MDKQINSLTKEQRKFLLHELITEEKLELEEKLCDLKKDIIEAEYKIQAGNIMIKQMELRLKYQEEHENVKQKGQFSDLIKELLKSPQTVK